MEIFHQVPSGGITWVLLILCHCLPARRAHQGNTAELSSSKHYFFSFNRVKRIAAPAVLHVLLKQKKGKRSTSWGPLRWYISRKHIYHLVNNSASTVLMWIPLLLTRKQLSTGPEVGIKSHTWKMAVRSKQGRCLVINIYLILYEKLLSIYGFEHIFKV